MVSAEAVTLSPIGSPSYFHLAFPLVVMSKVSFALVTVVIQPATRSCCLIHVLRNICITMTQICFEYFDHYISNRFLCNPLHFYFIFYAFKNTVLTRVHRPPMEVKRSEPLPWRDSQGKERGASGHPTPCRGEPRSPRNE